VQLVDRATGKPIWPLDQPNELAVAYAAMVRPSRDLRYTADWWRAAEIDNAERRQLA
jgi:hypothetical protein